VSSQDAATPSISKASGDSKSLLLDLGDADDDENEEIIKPCYPSISMNMEDYL